MNNSLWSLVLLLGILLIINGQQVERASGYARPRSFGLSVKTNTENMMNAFMKKDERTFYGYFRIDATIVNHNALATSGVHHGIINIINYFNQQQQLCESNATCKVLWTSQVRSMSAVECEYSGTARVTEKKFDNLRIIHYIKWRFGRVKAVASVHLDYKKELSIFETQAEQSFRKLKEVVFECTDCSNEMKQLISDNCEINVINFYPTSLAIHLLNETMNNLHLNPNEKTVYQISENSSNIVLRGHEGALVFLNLAKTYLGNRVITEKVLHSDNTTVEIVTVLGPRENMLVSDFTSIPSLLRECTLIYERKKFDQGKLVSAQILFNRPFLPWEIRRIQNQHREDEATKVVLAKLTTKVNTV